MAHYFSRSDGLSTMIHLLQYPARHNWLHPHNLQLKSMTSTCTRVSPIRSMYLLLSSLIENWSREAIGRSNYGWTSMDFDPRACQPWMRDRHLCFTATSHPCRSLSHSYSPLRVQNSECSLLSLPCICHRSVSNSDSFSVSLYDRHHPSWSYPSTYIMISTCSSSPDTESLMRRTKQDHRELAKCQNLFHIKTSRLCLPSFDINLWQ